MKRRAQPALTALILALFLLAACAAPAGEAPPGAEQDTAAGETAAEVPESGEEEENEPESPGQPAELTVSVEIADSEGILTPEEQALLRDFMAAWYRSVGSFETEDFTPYFLEEGQAFSHAASCRTMAAIRAAAPEDLHLTDCRITLTVTGEEGDRIYAEESAEMQFAAIPGIRSELFSLPHMFILWGDGEDCRIAWHEADDDPYFGFTYAEGNPVDVYFDDLMEDISARQTAPREQPEEPPYDHPYDRQAALDYMMTYAERRNGEWYVYDDLGGNCMNFGSQVLAAGGIPMDYEGEDWWFSDGDVNATNSFVNVEYFRDYAARNEGYGLVADPDADYYCGEVGDLILMGIHSLQHTTEICGLITDENGVTVDYLLCSNTTNYRNFPAGAYYYTRHVLVKIWGWNED